MKILIFLKQDQYWLFDATAALLSCLIGVIVVVGVIVTDVVVGIVV